MTSRKLIREEFDIARLLDAVDEAAEVAEQQGIKLVLIGGVAMQLYGSPRFTKDVDFAASENLQGLPSTRKLTFGGLALKASNGVDVDVAVRDDDYSELYEEAIECGVEFENLPVLVATPEYLAVMKFEAGRKKDLLDLDWLIQEEMIDVSATTLLIKKHLGKYAGKEFKALVQESLWRKSQGIE